MNRGHQLYPAQAGNDSVGDIIIGVPSCNFAQPHNENIFRMCWVRWEDNNGRFDGYFELHLFDLGCLLNSDRGSSII